MFFLRRIEIPLLCALLAACVSPGLKVPPVDRDALDVARQEIRAAPAVTNTYIPQADADHALAIIFTNLQQAARSVCSQVGEHSCIWDLELSNDSDLNAHAEGETKVVINRGVFAYAKSDEEVAFVVAHEIGHHIANHIAEQIVNARTGAVIGGLLMGALVAAVSRNDPSAGRRVGDATRVGIDAGARIGAVSFSVAEEKEADFLASEVLRRAGYDPRKARHLLITMGKMVGGNRTGFLATHPAGPERLATFDRTVAMGLGLGPDGMLGLVSLQDVRPKPNADGLSHQVAVRDSGLYGRVREAEVTPATSSIAPAQNALALVSSTRTRSSRGLKFELEAQQAASTTGCDRSVAFKREDPPAEIYRVSCAEQVTIIRCELGVCDAKTWNVPRPRR